MDQVEIERINDQYMSEFMEAFQTSINQMSEDGIRVSYVASKGRELSKYMAGTLDEEWRSTRGMEIQSVGIASITYSEESEKLINIRNRGAMLGDPVVREGYVQGSFARGMESAGGNPHGTVAGFMGMGMGMGTAGSFVGSASATNLEHMKMNQQPASGNPVTWICPKCGTSNQGKFCCECGSPRQTPDGPWTCGCGHTNTGKFCSECGKPRP